MSRVTNLMISVAGYDDIPNLESLSEWLAEPRGDGFGLQVGHGLGSLKSLTPRYKQGPLGWESPESRALRLQPWLWGGYKGPECEVWAGTLNWADLDAVLAYIFAIPWKYPEDVQVFLKDQDERSFRLYMYRGGTWKQYAPDPRS